MDSGDKTPKGPRTKLLSRKSAHLQGQTCILYPGVDHPTGSELHFVRLSSRIYEIAGHFMFWIGPIDFGLGGYILEQIQFGNLSHKIWFVYVFQDGLCFPLYRKLVYPSSK